MGNIITYKVSSDKEDKLKSAVKVACNFWNRFLIPKASIVVRLGIFTSKGFVIARAYRPYFHDNTMFGAIEFNTKYLDRFSKFDIAGTIIHEIAHTLGFGWDKWEDLFHKDTGIFKDEFIQEMSELLHMRVETDFGPGTQYSHWDEEKFDKELMTGFKDPMEYVLPITIEVMRLLGHDLIEELPKLINLDVLIKEASKEVFLLNEEVENLNMDYSEETEVAEELYYNKGGILCLG